VLIRVLKDVFSTLRQGSAKSRNAAVEAISDAGNPLAHWYAAHSGRLTEKWHHYLEIYHRHFQRFRGRSPVVLEIGVFHGGSLEMWRDYFGPGCRLFGVDIDPRCKAFEEAGTTILIGDQSDRGFLAQVREAVPKVDILIDDGGHTMNQQIATFEELYQHIADEGVYLCEDLHTSYIPKYGGGYREPASFIEYSKKLIDQLNAWYASEGDGLQVDDLTRTTYAMHYYDSVLVIEKRPMVPPRVIVAGRGSF
jgi:hypothetical protein